MCYHLTMKYQGVGKIIMKEQQIYFQAILFILILPAVAGSVTVHFKYPAAVLLLQSAQKTGVQVHQY